MEASEEWSSTRSWKDGICPLQGCGNRMGGGPLSFAPNPQDDDVQNNPEHDEFNADDNDRKRSRTEKDGMGAPNGSERPVARVLFGPTTIASELDQAQARYDDELSSLLKDGKFQAAHNVSSNSPLRSSRFSRSNRFSRHRMMHVI